jgi:predicted RND superfamily exporter protein
VIEPREPSARSLAWVGRIDRHRGAIVALALLLALLGGWAASRLRLDQELRRLLPDDFPSVSDLDRASDRLGNQNDLYVTIRSPSRAANVAFGEQLAARLAARGDLRWVSFRRDRSFFVDNALLYADLGDLLELRREVIGRIRDEVARQAYGDFGGGDRASATASLRERREGLEQRYVERRDFTEFDEADDGRLMVVRARPVAPPTDIEAASRLQAEIAASVAELEPTAFHPELTAVLDGAYAQHAKRVSTLRGEVFGGNLAAGAVLVLSIGLYFASIRAVVFVFVPLLAAVIGALALAWALYGFVNLVSAFIFAILLGLGIDYGILVLSRFRDERRRGRDAIAALAVTLSTSGRATAAGAASTAAAFASLTVADFQGFAQLGAIAAGGIVMALAAALVVLPALVLTFERRFPWRFAPLRPARASSPAARRVWRWIAIAVVVLGGVTAVASARVAGDVEFEYDFDALGPRREPEAQGQVGYRDAVGRMRTVAPAVVLADDTETAEAVWRQLEAIASLAEDPPAELDPATLSAPWPTSDPTPAAPARDLDDPDEVDELDEFDDDDLDDPRFTALERRVAERPRVAPALAADLLADGSERLAVRIDRFADATSVFAFLPTEQAEKLLVIADLRARLEAKRGLLSAETRREIDRWQVQLGRRRAITLDDLPAWVRDQFTDAQGRVGTFAVLWTRGSKADYRNARRIYDAYARLTVGATQVPVAAEFFVLPEVFDAIAADGPRVLALAALVMVITSFVAFRRSAAFFGGILTVPLALLWLVGLMSACGWKLDFFNVIALPLVVGMGQDDALHIIARFREDGDLRATIRDTGGAVFMTSWTTICGFAGMFFANHRGLQSLARTVGIGMTLAWVASVAVLPAVIALVAARRGGRSR